MAGGGLGQIVRESRDRAASLRGRRFDGIERRKEGKKEGIENVITGDHANLTPTSPFTSVQPLELIRPDFL